MQSACVRGGEIAALFGPGRATLRSLSNLFVTAFATLEVHVYTGQTDESPESCARHPRLAPSRNRAVEPRRDDRARCVCPLWLWRDSHAHLRGHAALRPRRGRGNGHRLERDVHVGGSCPRAERKGAEPYVA